MNALNLYLNNLLIKKVLSEGKEIGEVPFSGPVSWIMHGQRELYDFYIAPWKKN